MTAAPVTVYTMSDDGYVPGALALLGSLRVAGFRGRAVILDTGLSAESRERLARRATVQPLPGDPSVHPVLRKALVHELDPRGVVVLVDSDVILTRPLDHLVAEAEAGRICLYPDHVSTGDRAFPVWETAFELRAPLRPRRHLNTGLVIFSVDRWPGLLRRWADACARIPPDEVFVDVHREPPATRFASRPFWGGDQDAFNAILMSEIPEDAIAEQAEDELVMPDSMAEVDVVDEQTLECRYRGGSPVVLHYVLSPKPWQRAGWRRVRRDAYVRLLRRLLAAEVEPRSLPLWLRPGLMGSATLHALSLLNGGKVTTERTARAGVRALPAPVRRPLLALRSFLTTLRG